MGPAQSPAARYVAIITDGNGRWARGRGLPVNEGHEAGADIVKDRLRDAVALGIRELTVYSFSTENWSRPAAEVRACWRCSPGGSNARPRSCTRRGCGCASSAAAGSRAQWWSRWTGPKPDRRQRHVTCSWPSTTAGAPRSSTPRGLQRQRVAAGPSLPNPMRRVPSLPVRPEMHDPDLIIRTSGSAGCPTPAPWRPPTRADLPRRAVAGLHARGAGAVARRVQRPPPALRRALRRPMSPSSSLAAPRANGPHGWPPARGRAVGFERPRVAGPARDRLRAVRRDRGRGDLRAGTVRARGDLHARAVRDVRPRPPRPPGRPARAGRPAGSGALRGPPTGAAGGGRGAAGAVRADPPAAPPERGGWR